MPGIARWKMIDNLRRTISAPLTLATLVAAWTLPSVSAGLWTTFVLASVLVPAALPVLAGLPPRRKGISKRSHLRAVGADVTLAASHVGLGITLLAHQAWLMVDAIVRTLRGCMPPDGISSNGRPPRRPRPVTTSTSTSWGSTSRWRAASRLRPPSRSSFSS